MNKRNLIFLFLLLTFSCKNSIAVDFKKNKSTFLNEQLEFAVPIWKYIRSNKYPLNTLNQNDFTKKTHFLTFKIRAFSYVRNHWTYICIV